MLGKRSSGGGVLTKYVRRGKVEEEEVEEKEVEVKEEEVSEGR